MKPIALSFKNNPEDIELYKWITSHSNLSGFIKDILREKMNSSSSVEKKVVDINKAENSLIELDF